MRPRRCHWAYHLLLCTRPAGVDDPSSEDEHALPAVAAQGSLLCSHSAPGCTAAAYGAICQKVWRLTQPHPNSRLCANVNAARGIIGCCAHAQQGLRLLRDTNKLAQPAAAAEGSAMLQSPQRLAVAGPEAMAQWTVPHRATAQQGAVRTHRRHWTYHLLLSACPEGSLMLQ